MKRPRPPKPEGIAPAPRAKSKLPKPKLRDLSKRPVTREDEQALLQAFLSGSSPIVAAILGQAMVEYELEKLIRTRFKNVSDETWEEMTGDRGPLNTFSQKISAGFAFGFFDEVLRSHLDLIRNIRNVFAHAKLLVDFNDPIILGELKKVKFPSQKRSKFARLVKEIHSASDGKQAYQALRLSVAIVLLRRGTRMMVASNKRYIKRKWGSSTDKSPTLTRNYLKWYLENQNLDPRTAGLGAADLSLVTLAAAERDKEDK